MTNQEKEAVETLRANYPDACYEQLRVAVDMALEALELKQRILDNGYTGKEAEFRIGGRLFGIREKAQ